MEAREKTGKRSWALLGVVILAVMMVGCGRKGRPVPKDAMVPRAVVNLQAKKLDGAITLSWGEPKKDLRGKKLKDLAGYKVLKKVVKPGSNDCIDCPAGFAVAVVLDKDHPVNFKEEDDRIVWSDKDLQKSGTYVYRIVPFNANGYDGTISNYVSVKMP